MFHVTTPTDISTISTRTEMPVTTLNLFLDTYVKQGVYSNNHFFLQLGPFYTYFCLLKQLFGTFAFNLVFDTVPRPIPTLGGTDLCYFPFQYQGVTYTSCSLDNNTLLNNNGAPWCATEVIHISNNQFRGRTLMWSFTFIVLIVLTSNTFYVICYLW
jgi:hypothetical protein